MVMSYSMSNFFRQPLSIDTTGHAQRYFDDEDRTLDDTFFDHSAIDSGLEMSPPMADSRRDSLVLGSSSLFTTDASMQGLSSSNPFISQSNNPFFRLDQHQQQQNQQQHQQQHQHQYPQQVLSQQPGSWPMSASTSANSAVATPVPHFDGLQSTDFEAATAGVFPRTPMPLQTPTLGGGAGAMAGIFSVPRGSNMSPPAMTASPSMQGSGSSAGINASGSGIGANSSKKMMNSASTRTHPELRRGDGIRKKNTRFEIPAERNLNNIDILIAQTTDEQEIKELKQQKRLLRNRQAALDSRQRKKQHTERLEDEKKHYTVVMSDMEQTIENLRVQISELMEEKESYTTYIKGLELDKEEMVRQHTIESGELRKKISILSSHVSMGNTAPVLPTAASAYGAGSGVGVGAYGEIDGLSMSSWENVGLFSDMTGAEHQPQSAEIKQELQQLVPASRKTAANNSESSNVITTGSDSERAAGQGGLLFMLFLVGAFVMSSRQAPSIPRVSEDVRVASAELLENVLKDAGVPVSASPAGVLPSASVPSASVSMPSHAPAAAAPSWPAVSADAAASGIVEPSMLSQLSDQLIQPTEQQTADQMFSLSAAQYSSVVQHYEPTSQDRSSMAGSGEPSQGRRNLADALASMHVNSKAEVVTRSLLWDQIPSDVVHAFAKMWTETQAATGGEQ